MTDNGKSKGFGFVCFSTVKEASIALNAMNGFVLSKKPLYVNIAQSREERRRILRRLRSAVSFHAASFTGQPYIYAHSLSVSPSAQSLEQTSVSQVFSPYASMPFPLPMLVPPALVNTPTKPPKMVNHQAESSAKDFWFEFQATGKNGNFVSERCGEESKDLSNDANFENAKDVDAPYGAIPSQLSWDLYTKVSEKQTDERIAQKITGMLLDLGSQETENMINDDSLLSQRIEDSILVIINKEWTF